MFSRDSITRSMFCFIVLKEWPNQFEKKSIMSTPNTVILH